LLRSRDPFADPENLLRAVYAYVAYRIGDGPDAEDATSETFARALRYRESYDPRKGEPLSWLIGIARRCISEVAARPQPDTKMPPAATSDADIEENAARRLTLAAAVGLLNERDRELIALRYGADLTARQIARLQGARTNAVEVALHRALARLRTHLERMDPTEPPPARPDERRSPAHQTRAGPASRR
jgi:RNA polymerase sigma-70 factor, ECF subfamily